MSEIYELHAIRYAQLDRRSNDNFIGGDTPDVPMPMDYFIWAAVGPEHTVVIDTGFSQSVAAKRNRNIVTPVEEGLKAIGVQHEDVRHVILTHMHYDHAGNPQMFPQARFHLQECELAYATGPCICHPLIGNNYEADDVAMAIHRNFRGDLALLSGDKEIVPGITVHKLGGHTPGMQCVRVSTRRGPVLLASDASHYYAHFFNDRVFPVAHDIGGVLDGYSKMRALIPSADHFIPGHDPLVMDLYPPSRLDLKTIAVRLDIAPRASTA
jgi:glyoxylase-like metal-dependent hydrolase (beta-lactamase superfamily II)